MWEALQDAHLTNCVRLKSNLLGSKSASVVAPEALSQLSMAEGAAQVPAGQRHAVETGGQPFGEGVRTAQARYVSMTGVAAGASVT